MPSSSSASGSSPKAGRGAGPPPPPPAPPGGRSTGRPQPQMRAAADGDGDTASQSARNQWEPGDLASVPTEELLSWEERILAAVEQHMLKLGRDATSTPFDEHTVKALVDQQMEERLLREKAALGESSKSIAHHLTQDEVESLLQQTLKKHTKNYLSEDKILDLVEGHTLTEQRVREIVYEAQNLGEEQKKKEDVKALEAAHAKLKEETEQRMKEMAKEHQNVKDLLSSHQEDTERGKKDEAKALLEAAHAKHKEETEQRMKDLAQEHQKVKDDLEGQHSRLREVIDAHNQDKAKMQDVVSHQRLQESLEQQQRAMSGDHRRMLEEFAQQQEAKALSEEKITEMLQQHKKGMASEQKLKEVIQSHKRVTEEQLQEMLASHAENTVSEARVKQMLDDHADVGMSQEKLHEWLDLHKTNCREMVLLHLSGQPAVHMGQLPTSPGAFSASQQAQSLVQDKARWSAGRYTSLSAVPDAGVDGILTHKDMEKKLVARTFAAQPDHNVAGWKKVEVHDMVNNVVREIVGTFESLLDRLLIEKKQDTIRVMVAELLTEDLSKTIATGREQLKKQEMGHVIDELGRLRQEFHDQKAAWETRFQMTHELSASQDDMWATVDDHHRDHAGRLGVVERDTVRTSELDARLKVVAEELAELRVHAMSNIVKHDETAERLDVFKDHCRETFATRAELENASAALDKEIRSSCEKLDKGLADLRTYCAADERVGKLEVSYDERLKVITSQQLTDKMDIGNLDVRLTKEQRYAQENFVQKAEHEDHVSTSKEEREHMGKTLRAAIERLEASSATKRTVADDKNEVTQELAQTKNKLGETIMRLDKQIADLRQLDDRATNELATKEYCVETADIQARRIASECDEKEEIAQLRREFDEERERLRQTIRQTQTTRKDLTDAQELLHNVKLHSTDVEKTCASVSEDVKVLVEREDEHWRKQQAAFAEWRHCHSDLAVQHTVLKDELRSNIEYQRSEGEKLRHHSTQRYLEQMDKALSLNSTVNRLDVGHRELKDTVIRLPKV